MKVKDIKTYPQPDASVVSWAVAWRRAHGRDPDVNELPSRMGVALGKKVFEYMDFRDKHRPDDAEEMIYEGCLCDHGVARHRPDGGDAAYKAARYKLRVDETAADRRAIKWRQIRGPHWDKPYQGDWL